MTASIAVSSAIVAFGLVRAFVPVRATEVPRAQLQVDTQPAGATLVIDDKLRGTTPLALVLDAGTHTVSVRAGQVERTVRVSLTAGAQSSQYFDLSTHDASPSAAARLSVVTDPPGAQVAVDGRKRGASPLVVDDVPAGDHVVSVSSDAGSATRSVALTNGNATEVVFSLPKSTAPVAGWVAVTSPFPVDIVEHDEVVGTSGAAKIMLAAGRHDLLLRSEAAGYEASRTIDVAAGRVTSLDIVAPTALLNVNARPWADVLIDGNAAGQTPLANIEVTAGPHQITFRHPQLGERTASIIVKATGVNRVAVDLNK